MGSVNALSRRIRYSLDSTLAPFTVCMKQPELRKNLLLHTCGSCSCAAPAERIQRTWLSPAGSSSPTLKGVTLSAPWGCRGMKFVAKMGLVKDSALRKFFVPDFARDPSYNKLCEEDRRAFCSKLSDPHSQVLWVPIPRSSDEADVEKKATLYGDQQDDMDKAAAVSAVANYTTDWLGVYTPEAVEGSAAVVLLPRTTEEVQRILEYCSRRRLAVCIQAGNTGLVGGSVPVFDEVVVSLTKMNKILSFDAETGVLVVEAGCLISDVEAFLQNFPQAHRHTKRYESCNELNATQSVRTIPVPKSAETTGEAQELKYPAYMYPLDLASKGSCCVGGTVATAAGGNRYLRYGGAHNHVLGLEAVMGDGRLLQQLNTNQKNNECMHLHQLFIGSEGTLGVITKVAVQCVPAPRSTTVTLLQIRGPFERLRHACIKAKESLNDILSALEFFDETCMTLTTRAAGLTHPFANPGDSSQQGGCQPQSSSEVKRNDRHFYLLVETQGQCAETDSRRVEAFAELLAQEELIQDAVLSLTETQKMDTWRLRDDIATAASSNYLKVLKFDVSLDVASMYRPVELVNALLAEGRLDGDFQSLMERGEELLRDQGRHETPNSLPAIAVGYGHIGDGNIHINVLVQHRATAEEVRQIQRFCDILVYGFVRQHKGSISAEHGVGVLKAAAVPEIKGSVFLELVKGVKRCFDPQGILNPYKGWRTPHSDNTLRQSI